MTHLCITEFPNCIDKSKGDTTITNLGTAFLMFLLLLLIHIPQKDKDECEGSLLFLAYTYHTLVDLFLHVLLDKNKKQMD